MVDSPFANLPKIRSRGGLADTACPIIQKAIIIGSFSSGMWFHEELLGYTIGSSNRLLNNKDTRTQ